MQRSKGNQQKSGDIFSHVKGWHLLVALILTLIGCIYYLLQVQNEAYSVTPEKVFKENFSNPLSDISGLEGGGENTGYFTVHIKFKCPSGARLKNAAKFRDEFVGPAKDWFSSNDPNDSDLYDPNDLELLSRSEHESASSIINEWLLVNKKTHTYYFRSWGQK